MQMRAIHKKRKHGGGPGCRPRGRRSGCRPARPARSALSAAAGSAEQPRLRSPAGLCPPRSSGTGTPCFGARTGRCAGFAQEKAAKWEIGLSCRRRPVRTPPAGAALHPPTATYPYNGRNAPSPSPWPRPAPASFIKSAPANTDIADGNAKARRLEPSTLNFPATEKVSKYFMFGFQCRKEVECFLTNIFLLRPKMYFKGRLHAGGIQLAHTHILLLWISSKPVTLKILRDS